MDSAGRKLHAQAAQAREKGEHLEALKLQDEAMLAYQKDGDVLGLAELLADRSIVFRHLFDDSGDKNLLIISKHEMEASVEMAESSGNKEALALPYFNLAKVQESLEELNEAVANYQKALDNLTANPPQNHNRATVIADFKVHLQTCKYKAGEKVALEEAEKALSELEAVPTVSDEQFEQNGNKLDYNQEITYNKNVWLSGAHMKIAEILKEDNSDKAKEHLQKAKEIIDSDSRLTIRLKQWEKLAKSFK